MNPPCQDKRVPELFARFLGRNFCTLLKEKVKERWDSFCVKRLLGLSKNPKESLSWVTFDKELARLEKEVSNPRGEAILRELREFQTKSELELIGEDNAKKMSGIKMLSLSLHVQESPLAQRRKPSC